MPEDLIQQDIDTSTPTPEVDNSDAALDKELSNSLEAMSGDFDSFSGESEIEIPSPARQARQSPKTGHLGR